MNKLNKMIKKFIVVIGMMLISSNVFSQSIGLEIAEIDNVKVGGIVIGYRNIEMSFVSNYSYKASIATTPGVMDPKEREKTIRYFTLGYKIPFTKCNSFKLIPVAGLLNTYNSYIDYESDQQINDYKVDILYGIKFNTNLTSNIILGGGITNKTIAVNLIYSFDTFCVPFSCKRGKEKIRRCRNSYPHKK